VHPEPNRVAAIPLFANLSPDKLDRLAMWLEVRTEDTGARITSEGASGYFFFILEKGSAVVSQGDVEVNRMEPGDYFGEMAILGGGRRTASVTTTSPSTLLVMFGTDFRQLELLLPETAELIRTRMSERLGTTG
jgi:voltage-gated potassium channel